MQNDNNLQNSITEMNSASTSMPSYAQERQLKREHSQRDQFLGRRQRKTIESQVGGRASQTDGCRGVRMLMVPFIENWIEKHLEVTANRGRAGTAVKELNRLNQWVDAATMAHITLSVILDKLGRGHTLRAKITNVQCEIGSQIEHQAQIAYMEEVDPSYFQQLQKWYLHDPVRRYDKKIAAMRHAHNRHDEMEWTRMTDDELVRVGSCLLQAAMSVVVDPDTKEGFFERKQPQFNDKNRQRPKKNQADPYYLGYTKAGIKYRDQIQRAADIDWMQPRPMVCEPMEWTPEQRGGYLTHATSKIQSLVHNNNGSEPSSLVYDALNRLQKQSFRVNQYILDLQLELLKKSWEIGSFRSYEKDSWEDEHFPMVDSEWLATLDKESVEYKDQMKTLMRAYQSQKIEEQKAEAPRRIAFMAAEFRDDVFWFPWFLDNRGRLYPVVTGFSPQGPDYGKALLKSADGAPLTEDSRRDLLISIATAGAFDGVDKKDFFERLKWSEEYTRTEEFKAMVEDPMTYRQWMEADEPFCFLALCEEYKAVFIDESRSRVYVFFGRDQTCSGVQILSAIIKDEKAAYFTNVLVTEEPQDLYGEVAKEAQALMRNPAWLQDQMERREAKRPKLNAKRKPDQQIEKRDFVDVDPSVHDRKVNKTQAMTCGYGATVNTRYGAMKKALLKKQKKNEIPNIHPGDINIVCKAGIDGMQNAFPAYMDLNKWFKNFAKAALKKGLEKITWTTPSGMFVSQEYREPIFKEVHTYAAGGGHYAHLNLCSQGKSFVETGYGDPKLSKNQSAIAANWTHSLDASVMVLGTLDVPEDIHLYTVHDCVYTLSGYFSDTIPHFRKAMHNVVTSPVLEELLESNELTDEVEMPEIGELDVDQILESPYLFC